MSINIVGVCVCVLVVVGKCLVIGLLEFHTVLPGTHVRYVHS